LKNLRMDASHSVVVLVDYQERLMPAIHGGNQVIARARLIAQAAAQLKLPVIATAQNPTKLGRILPVIEGDCPTVVDKAYFGACDDGLLPLLPAGSDIVIAGCEAHVCLLQTALGLMEAGYRVWVVADASGSRRPSDHELAMRRLSSAGAQVVSAEMVVFEWLRTYEHPCFREISTLVKQTG
jgi:nicotinamidase-related amidase